MQWQTRDNQTIHVDRHCRVAVGPSIMSDTAVSFACQSGVEHPDRPELRLSPPADFRLSSHREYSAQAQFGFTVLELVVVMVVIGILSVVVLPRLDLFDGFDQLGYRDRVRATLEYARKSAVAQRRKVQVTLAAGSVTVLIASDVPDGAAANTFDRNLVLPGSNSNTFNAPAGVTLSPPAVLVFDALGQPSAGGSFTITGSGDPIVVEAVTGYVH
jgi:MSHA pilin protein MshC